MESTWTGVQVQDPLSERRIGHLGLGTSQNAGASHCKAISGRAASRERNRDFPPPTTRNVFSLPAVLIPQLRLTAHHWNGHSPDVDLFYICSDIERVAVGHDDVGGLAYVQRA